MAWATASSSAARGRPSRAGAAGASATKPAIWRRAIARAPSRAAASWGSAGASWNRIRQPSGFASTQAKKSSNSARARGAPTGLPDGPVIVATGLPDAARLLGDASVRWTGGNALCLDLGLGRRRGDPFVVCDLDEGAWIERFTATDRTLAPHGTELLQAQIGIREGEPAGAATARLEAVLDAAFPGWRGREVWRRRQVMTARSGALDLPGTTWRDRPAVAQRDGVFLAGDMVAAEGLLCEVSFAAAAQAARLACASAAGRPHREAAATA